MTPERKTEMRVLCVEALNAPTGTRPPYGDTSGRFDLTSAQRSIERLEYAEVSREAQDELFVTLRGMSTEVELLRAAVKLVPEALAEIDRLEAERDSVQGRLAAGLADRIAPDAAKLEADLAEAIGNFEGAQARIAAQNEIIENAGDTMAKLDQAASMRGPSIDVLTARVAEIPLDKRERIITELLVTARDRVWLVEQLTRERDEARAEVDRLRAMIGGGS